MWGKVAQILGEVAAFEQIDLRDEEIFLYAVKNTSKIDMLVVLEKILDTVRACLRVRNKISLLLKRFFPRRPGGTYLESVTYYLSMIYNENDSGGKRQLSCFPGPTWPSKKLSFSFYNLSYLIYS